VKKISGYIMKKVSEKLDELFKKDRENFESKWDDIKVFIEYGMISEEKFYEKAEKFALVKNTEGKYFTLEEYKKHVEPTQKDKDGKLVYLYASNKEDQHGFIAAATEKGYDVLLMDGILDNHFINTLEQKSDNNTFRRVDSDTIDKLILKEENNLSKLDDAQKDQLKQLIEKIIEKERFTVVFENLGESDAPFCITQPEFMRRMKDMSAIGGGIGLGNMPEFYNLVVNVNHPLMGSILEAENETRKDEMIRQVYDLALISQNLLKGEKLTAFVKRSIDLLK
jgi:molecular chaperone HtpG